VFQDPFASLNPRLGIGYQLGEPLLLHGLCGRGEVRDHVGALLARVGLSPGHARLYPHQFSGGQRQRIAIARALAVEPDLIVADEAVSALDVSVRAQILNLIEDIKHGSDLSMVFISHDLGVVRHVADRVAVMFLGRIVEIGPVAEVFAAPRHPYTRTLLEAMPIAIPGRRRAVARPALASDSGTGCSFASRCPLARAECRASPPPLAVADDGRASACFRAMEVPPFVVDAERLAGPAELRLRRLQSRYLAAAAAGAGG
jgi:oligopeptide transport system ATP-binding protein